MPEIPKFVQSRLSRSMAGVHPDADVLTAFVERALAERERTRVMEHLAACGDCRDIVALSQPEPVGEAHNVVESGKKGFFRWPVLRWVAVAACLVVGGRVAWQMSRPKDMQPYSVAKQAAPPPAVPSASEAVVTRNEMKTDHAAERDAIAPPRQKIVDAAPLRAVAPRSADALSNKKTTGARDQLAGRDKNYSYGGYSNTAVPAPAEERKRADLDTKDRFGGYSKLQISPGVAEAAQVAATPPPPVSKEVIVVADNVVQPEADAKNKQLAKAEIAGDKGAASRPDDRAVQNLPLNARNVEASGAAVAETAAKAPAAAPIVGSASQTVEVTAAASPVVEGRSGALSELQTTAMRRAPSILPRWRLAKDRRLQRADAADNRWQDVALEGRPALDALFFSGPHVWVGGKGGVLFHSADAGEHWQRVTASHDGAMLIDDVVAIDFKDFQRGELKTGKKDIWITSDGGQTWAPK